MATFGTGDLKNLPRNIADGMVKDAKSSSVVAKLSPTEPMRFGDVDIITFNDQPKAEFVDEGAEKSSSKGAFGVVTAKPRKAQVTQRFNQEVQWADDDYKLSVLKTLSDAGSLALSRALDLGVIHRINPLTGNPITSWTNWLNNTSKRVEIGADPELDIEAAVGLVLGAGKPVTGLALDPTYAYTLATARYADGRKKFPDVGYGTNITNVNGLNVAVGDTVSGRPEAADTGVRGLVGDFGSGIRWGVQKNIPVELIKYGDPDGGGDLKRKNQIALRLEIVYGWYVFEDRFAAIEVADEDPEEG